MDVREKKRKRKRLIRAVIFLAAVMTAAAIAVWLGTYARADEKAVGAYVSDLQVEERILEGGDLAFGTGDEEYGLIFYPGAKVDEKAYVPLMEELASNGVFCVVCKMPLHLALLKQNAADGIIEAFPGIGHWYIGGHSLGGVISASYLAKHADDFEGIVLLGAYSITDLSETDLEALLLYGSEDGVLNMKKYEENRRNLPADTRETVLEGGCHAYFGMYGEQRGDGEASISNADQVMLSAQEILNLIKDTD